MPMSSPMITRMLGLSAAVAAMQNRLHRAARMMCLVFTVVGGLGDSRLFQFVVSRGSPADRLEHDGTRISLAKIGGAPRRDCLCTPFWVIIGGEENDRRLFARSHELPLQFDSRYAVKLHIEQQAAERRRLCVTKKCFRRWICHRVQSRRAQQPAKRTAQTFIVIDDGNREMIEELLHTKQLQTLALSCLSDYCPLGKVPATCASRASSATDLTPSFVVTLVRCSFTVRSQMPRSSAICLFSAPRTTCSSTWRSRSLSFPNRPRAFLVLARVARSRASRAIAQRKASS